MTRVKLSERRWALVLALAWLAFSAVLLIHGDDRPGQASWQAEMENSR